MSEDNIAVLERSRISLQHAPHVLTSLIDLFYDGTVSTLKQREHIQEHLTICHLCRTAFLMFLSSIQEYHQTNQLDDTISRDLLTRFTDLSQKLEALESYDYEGLGVYAEAVIDGGINQAAQQFPELAVHLTLCSICRIAVVETIADAIASESFIQ
jgi:hypothetical protein